MEAMKRILLAEDDEHDVELTLEALGESNLANNVDVVRDGEEALDYLHCRGRFATRENNRPIVILLDLKMPKVNGLEVLRHIKTDDQLKTIPVVILTSSREDRDLEESYQLGVNAYIVKPVDIKQFFEGVQGVGLFWGVLNQPPS